MNVERAIMVDGVTEIGSADVLMLQSQQTAAAQVEAQRSNNTEGQSDAALFQAEIDKHKEAAAAAADATTSSADVFMMQSSQMAPGASTAPLALNDAPLEAGNSPIGTASASAGTDQQALSLPEADEQPTGFQIGATEGGKPEKSGFLASVHGILDTGSYVPYVGTAFSMANAAVYAGEGQFAAAGTAVVEALPFVKQVKGVRLAAKAVVAATSVEDLSGTDKPKTEVAPRQATAAPQSDVMPHTLPTTTAVPPKPEIISTPVPEQKPQIIWTPIPEQNGPVIVSTPVPEQQKPEAVGGGYQAPAIDLPTALTASAKPDGVPAGTLPIDKAKRKFGLDKDDVHAIKDGVGAGPTDWVGIDPQGNVWTGDENNQGENNGSHQDYLP
jgi:hypothetical protein